MADSDLSPKERVKLLELARQTLYQFVSRGTRPKPVVEEERLNEQRGVFVSLHIGPNLRGCIGTFSPSVPLYEAVMDMTVNAATHDVRFAPVRSDEVSKIEIELSVLSPLRRVQKIEEIEAGRHGIFVTKDRRRGVLLPQVAAQYGWDRETFLAQTCAKAGLPARAWKDPETVIEVFTADVFSESTVDWG